MNWIDDLINDYHKWLRSNTLSNFDTNTGWASITTPFSGIFNDLLEIYIQQKNGKLLLSDDGETLRNLTLVGANVRKGEKRSEIFNQILINYGVSRNGDELIVEATQSNFPQKKHNFISALIELNDISLLSNHNVAHLFREDVRSFLDEKKIIYTPDFICKGESGIEFNFDFVIPQKEKEIVIKSFNSLNKQNLPAFLYAWEDIQPVRVRATKKTVEAIAFINDTEKGVATEFLDALAKKNASHILWSNRNTEQNILALAP